VPSPALLSAILALAATTEPAKTAATTAEAVAAPSEADAADDVLATLDLPIATAAARDAGVGEEDIKDVLSCVQTSGIGAASATVALDAEARASKSDRGKIAGFGQWVRAQVAAGLRGKELAAAIRERKAELEELTAEKKSQIQSKLEAMAAAERERRRKLHELRRELAAKGKEIQLLWRDEHDRLRSELRDLVKAKRGHGAAHRGPGGPAGAGSHGPDAAAEDAREAREDAHEAKDGLRETRQDAREAKQDAREARQDAREARQDAREAAHEAKEAAREAKEAAREARREGKATPHGDEQPGRKN
jgi:hypothetical protein